MRARIELDVNPSEKSALGSLTSEEREAVIDEMLAQVREDLEWLVALESSRNASPIEVSPGKVSPGEVSPAVRGVAAAARPLSATPPPPPGGIAPRRFSWPASSRR
jgi:hypothetical protein